MLAQRIREPAQTRSATPIVIAHTKERAARFCVAFQKLNAATKHEFYLIPQNDACIDSVLDSNLIDFGHKQRKLQN